MAHHANLAYSKKTIPGQDLNYTMMQGFEWYSPNGGVHWNNLKERVPEFSDMGVTALWLPPPCKASGKDAVGYDIYDVWDLGEFNQKADTRTKYGTKDQLVELVRYADEHGIVTYIDAVLNHKFGADGTQLFLATEVDPNDRTHDISWPYDILGWTKYDFPGRNGKYSKFQWNFNHFTGVDFDQQANDGKGRSGIWRVNGYGKYWASGVDSEKRNYDYLMGADIDHKHPEVKDDLFSWGEWVVDSIGAAGFRFDAIKHIDYGFMSEFIKSARARTQKPAMFAVGEFWKDSLWDINNYLNHLGTQFSVFDVPLHYNFKEASDSWNRFDMRTIFNDTLVKSRPIDAVTFVDNHDTQPWQSLESWVQPWFKPLAYALILLRPDGYPCVFYGDLYGTGGEHPQQPMHQLADFVRARKLFAYGETWDWLDHPNCIGWVRTGDKDHDGCAVVLCNGSEGFKRMTVGKEHAGEKWTDVLGWHQGEVTIGDDGWATFMCSGGSVSIWTKVDARGREEFKKM